MKSFKVVLVRANSVFRDFLPLENSQVEHCEGAKENLADDAAMSSALKIKTLVGQLTKDDLLLTLISGGGSSLLACPTPPITVEELRQLTALMSRNGATIHQLNTVRKQVEQLKGGKLAKLASPSTVSYFETVHTHVYFRLNGCYVYVL